MVDGNMGHHLSVVPYLRQILIRGLRGIKCQKFGFLDIFSETGHCKFLIFLHDGRGQQGASFKCSAIFRKNLNLGIKCRKLRFLDIFSIKSFKFFCMMVEGNRGHHMSVVPYLKKILIWGLSVKNLGFWTFSRKLFIQSFQLFA